MWSIGVQSAHLSSVRDGQFLTRVRRVARVDESATLRQLEGRGCSIGLACRKWSGAGLIVDRESFQSLETVPTNTKYTVQSLNKVLVYEVLASMLRLCCDFEFSCATFVVGSCYNHSHRRRAIERPIMSRQDRTYEYGLCTYGRVILQAKLSQIKARSIEPCSIQLVSQKGARIAVVKQLHVDVIKPLSA